MSETPGTYPFDTPKRTAFAYGPGVAPVGMADRAAWAGAIAAARRAGARAIETHGAIARDLDAAFLAAVKAAGRASFPAPHLPAQKAAAAFLKWCEAWVAAARPADRLALAPTLKTMAAALDEYLAEEARAYAELTARRLPAGDRD